jgi:transcription-repair coupling factor (superfamily II helicase)
MSLSSLLSLLEDNPSIRRILKNVKRAPFHQVIRGLFGGSRAYILSGLCMGYGGDCLIITQTQDLAEELKEEVDSFNQNTAIFPHLEILPYEDATPHYGIIGLRLSVLDRLLDQRERLTIISPIRAILGRVIPPERLLTARRIVSLNQSLELEDFVRYLVARDYESVEMVEIRGEFSVRGGIVDVWPPTSANPVRIEFFGNEVHSIRSFDPITQRSTGSMEEARILPAKEKTGESTIFDYLRNSTLLILDGTDYILAEVDRIIEEVHSLEREEGTSPGVGGPLLGKEEFIGSLKKYSFISINPIEGLKEIPPQDETRFTTSPIQGLKGMGISSIERIASWYREGWRILFVTGFSGQAERIREVLEESGIYPLMNIEASKEWRIAIVVGDLKGGFEFKDLGLIVITDHDLFQKRRPKRRRFIHEDSVSISNFIDLKVGDLIVHVNYGIGRYLGIKNLVVEGVRRDLFLIEYAEGDRLYIPLDQLGLIQKYIGDKDHPPRIYRLGGNAWEVVKQRVKRSIRDMAKELLKLYAVRHSLPGHSFSKDTPWQYEFEAGFKYEETPDQIKAIEEIKRDMERPRPMDRLVCGDVGYGKTEVAIRAAFKAVMDHHQVAVLVPTTILAQQHLASFRERLAPYPIQVEMLSRFKSRVEQREILQGLKDGRVDIVIGTHRLLQDDVVFRRLGLVVIDEEQRFGVKDKEKLKQMRRLVDVLTLTATPIPRTLYMSFMKIRDMSLINTPIPDRLPIETYVGRLDERMIRRAILREMDRGGQIYFVHNFVHTIEKTAAKLMEIVPEARLAVAHGKMAPRELERIMLQFLEGKYDVLVCTSIIESGLDIPNVNTILVTDAHKFGLAQLYQLRGRVGRTNHKAYAYFFYPRNITLSHDAMERLLAMREFTELGSGFKLAMRDMEIRGVGNLLGPEQHGNLVAVGFDLYCRLLDQVVAELKGEEVKEEEWPQVDLSLDAYIPEEFIKEVAQRFSIYKRLSMASSSKDVDGLRAEMRDRYGPLPKPVLRLLDIVDLRIMARTAKVLSIVPKDGRVEITLPFNGELAQRVLKVARQFQDRVWLDPTRREVLHLRWDGEEESLDTLKGILREFCDG